MAAVSSGISRITFALKSHDRRKKVVDDVVCLGIKQYTGASPTHRLTLVLCLFRYHQRQIARGGFFLNAFFWNIVTINIVMFTNFTSIMITNGIEICKNICNSGYSQCWWRIDYINIEAQSKPFSRDLYAHD